MKSSFQDSTKFRLRGQRSDSNEKNTIVFRLIVVCKKDKDHMEKKKGEKKLYNFTYVTISTDKCFFFLKKKIIISL